MTIKFQVLSCRSHPEVLKRHMWPVAAESGERNNAPPRGGTTGWHCSGSQGSGRCAVAAVAGGTTSAFSLSQHLRLTQQRHTHGLLVEFRERRAPLLTPGGPGSRRPAPGGAPLPPQALRTPAHLWSVFLQASWAATPPWNVLMCAVHSPNCY